MDFPIISNFRIILFFHLLGFAIGIGGAIASDSMFFRFLKDFRISNWEAKVMRALSKMVWAGLILLLVSGIALFFFDPARYATSPKFLAKMTVIIILAINGARLHFLYAPKLHKIAYTEKHPRAKKYEPLRKGAFISGGISVASWLSAFTLAWVKWENVSYFAYIGAYLVFAFLAVQGSLTLDKVLHKQSKKRD